MRFLTTTLPAVLLACLLFGPSLAHAQIEMPDQGKPPELGADGKDASGKTEEEPVAFKFTPTRMGNSDGSTALDLNLRVSKGAHYSWLAYYYDTNGGKQWRTGYEYRIDQPYYRLVLSPQWAGGGYLGASVSGEIGADTFAILGWGRSNLKNSYSLFPDPADAIAFGVGSRAIKNIDLAAYQLWDNRLHTGRRVNHIVARFKLPDRQRLTIDLSNKFGPDTNGRQISGSSYNITYDYKDFFIRIARDAYVGFSPFNQTRIAIGFRF